MMGPKSWPCHLPAGWPWPSSRISLSPGFLSCKMSVRILLASYGTRWPTVKHLAQCQAPTEWSVFEGYYCLSTSVVLQLRALMARKEAQLISCPPDQSYFPGSAVPRACPVGSRPCINCAKRVRMGSTTLAVGLELSQYVQSKAWIPPNNPPK